MHGRRTCLVPISGLFVAVLIIALFLSSRIVAIDGTACMAVIVFPLSYVFVDVLTEVSGYASVRRVV